MTRTMPPFNSFLCAKAFTPFVQTASDRCCLNGQPCKLGWNWLFFNQCCASQAPVCWAPTAWHHSCLAVPLLLLFQQVMAFSALLEQAAGHRAWNHFGTPLVSASSWQPLAGRLWGAGRGLGDVAFDQSGVGKGSANAHKHRQPMNNNLPMTRPARSQPRDGTRLDDLVNTTHAISARDHETLST